MKLAEKIVHLRIANNVSQEKLAALLNVSRQAISKWESGKSLPQIDKILELSKLFKITTDELLDDEIVIHCGKKINIPISESKKTKYFGTDGFKGEVNKTLTSNQAYKIGRFIGWFYSNPKYNLQNEGYRPAERMSICFM